VATYTYPSSAELRAIDQELMPRMIEGRVLFDILPMEEADTFLLRWDQADNFLGLQNVRGLNGEPPRIKRIGQKTWQMVPGVFGEYIEIDEEELTTRRQIGSFNEPIRIDDLVTQAEAQLLERELDRVELIGWTLLATGTFSVSSINGQVIHTDSYTLQTFSAGTPWATVATATPIANFNAVQLLSRGHGVNFGASARAYMNRATANNLFGNTNAADLGGKKSAYGASVNGVNDINPILMGLDLPEVAIYDQGYLDDTNTFQLFIPNNKVVVIGKRPGDQKVGAYRMCRNANNPTLQPGPYTTVYDSMADGNNKPPRKIEVHRGHNGGPCLMYPSAVVMMTV